MDLKDIIQNKRFSIRRFISDTLSPAEIRDVLQNALLAPSAGNLQPLRVYHTNDKKKIKALAKVAKKQLWIEKAPLVFVICHVPQESEIKYADIGYQYSIQDATIFCTYLDLLCQEYGWGTCWVGEIDTTEVKKIMEIPEGIMPLNYLVVGKPHPQAPKTRWPRKTIKQITS